MFTGVFTALITPFKNSEVDTNAFCDFIEWQIEEGVHGIVVCGTTGEAPTLNHNEHKKLIELAVKTVKARIPVIAGATSNNTNYAIEMANNAKIADALLIAPPYYNKPTQEGINRHYEKIAKEVKKEIIVYNIPSRCSVDITNDTMKKILQIPEVIGIKDSTGDLTKVTELKQKEISILSGEDGTAVAFNAQGGQGCISVTSNVAPKMCSELQNYCMKNDFVNAQKINEKLFPLHKSLFCETNPIPVKYAVSLIRKNITPEMRLPLLTASPSAQEQIKNSLNLLGIKNLS
ncbi:MAG: 4-hydroxy-tetrahydrodipicolinate synthase [Rickettsiaceae bacterium H1]|nr:4-hydroxy-tetrahydrodipicolinate synthase [Rickettsiaceae bacterium H1]